MTTTWGCPHESEGNCQKILGRPCDPGMKGCVLSGRYVFVDGSKNRPTRNAPEDDPRRQAEIPHHKRPPKT